jgi:glycosyltransferase involved in cell wall biosynthesis
MIPASTILFVGHTGQVSGAERLMLSLVDEALNAGYRVKIACPQGPLVDMLPPAATHVLIPPLGLGGERGPARLVAVTRLVRRWWAAGRGLAKLVRDPDTSTIVNSMYALPSVRLARPERGAAWLVHDTASSTKQRVVTRLGRPAVRVAVALSEAAAAPLRAAGLPVRVGRYGVKWPVPRLSTELHSPPVVGMLALLTPWKGHRVLLDAVAMLSDVHLELAGSSFPSDERYVAELRERALRPDLAGRVRFVGHVDPEAALRGWDVVVSASVEPEAGPLSVLEAMSYGLPVIGTNHGGTAGFLKGGAGLLVPPGDAGALAEAIGAVLSDGQLRDEMTETARRRVASDHDIAATLPLTLRALLT